MMRLFRKTINFCVKFKVILIPVLLIYLLDSVLQMFDVVEVNNIDLFKLLEHPFDAGEKTFSAFVTFTFAVLDYMDKSWPIMIYYVFSTFFQYLILYGMIILALNNHFSTIGDCFIAIKKYWWRYLKSIMVIGLLMLVSFAVWMIIIWYLSNFISKYSPFVSNLIAIGGLLLYVFLIYWWMSVLIFYGNYAFMIESNIRNALKNFFCCTSKCWLSALPLIITIEIAILCLKMLLSKLDYLVLLSTINSSILDAIGAFIKAVWLIALVDHKNKIATGYQW